MAERGEFSIKTSHNFFRGKEYELTVFGFYVGKYPSRYRAEKAAKAIKTVAEAKARWLSVVDNINKAFQ